VINTDAEMQVGRRKKEKAPSIFKYPRPYQSLLHEVDGDYV